MGEVPEARIFGLVVLEQRKAFEALFGEGLLARVYDLMPPERRREYENLSPLSWCANETAVAALEAMAQATGRNREALTVELVRAAVERTFRGPWKALMRFYDDDALVRRAAMLYAKAVDAGDLVATKKGEGKAELMLVGRRVDELDRIALAAGIETVLRVSGRVVRNVEWEEEPSGATRYFIEWVPQRGVLPGD